MYCLVVPLLVFSARGYSFIPRRYRVEVVVPPFVTFFSTRSFLPSYPKYSVPLPLVASVVGSCVKMS